MRLDGATELERRLYAAVRDAGWPGPPGSEARVATELMVAAGDELQRLRLALDAERLRLAGQAAAGALAFSNPDFPVASPEAVADRAVAVADAILARLKQRGPA